MAALNRTIEDGGVIWKVVKRHPDPPVVTPESLNVYTKPEIINLLDDLKNWADGRFLKLTGGTVTGDVTVTGKFTPGSIQIPSARGNGNFWIA